MQSERVGKRGAAAHLGRQYAKVLANHRTAGKISLSLRPTDMQYESSLFNA